MAATAAGSVLFISPHLDDVALSCPALLRQLRRDGQAVYLLNVFTEDITESGTTPNRFGAIPYALRRAEDAKVTGPLGLKVTHLGFSDAPFRESRYADWLGILFGEGSSDRTSERKLAAELVKVFQVLVPDQVYLPLGAGHHIDHRIVCEAVKGLTRLLPPSSQFWFYEDRPYVFAPHTALVRLKELDYEVPLSLGAYAAHWRATRKLTIHQNLLEASARRRFDWKYLKYLFRVKWQSPRRSLPAHKLVVGTDQDLDFAWRLAKGYESQFPFLFRTDEEFLQGARDYAALLCGKPTAYAERYWKLT